MQMRSSASKASSSSKPLSRGLLPLWSFLHELNEAAAECRHRRLCKNTRSRFPGVSGGRGEQSFRMESREVSSSLHILLGMSRFIIPGSAAAIMTDLIASEMKPFKTGREEHPPPSPLQSSASGQVSNSESEKIGRRSPVWARECLIKRQSDR